MASERDNEPDIRLNISRNPSAGSYSYICNIDGGLKYGTIPFSDSIADRLAQVFSGVPANKEILITSALTTRGIGINRNEAFLTLTQLREITDGLSDIRSDLYFSLTSSRPRFNES
jgi:hypothetical protein